MLPTRQICAGDLQNTDFQAIFAGRAQGHEGDAHGTATQKTRIMAIIKSPLGKFKGRIGNTVFYDRNGENLVRKKPAPRPLRTEAQKRHAAEFGTIADIRGVANELIQVGFPGGGGLPKGGNGFIRINLATSEENLREGASRLRHFWNKHSEGGCL